MKILVLIADLGGVYQYRVRIPMDSLLQYGVTWQPYSFLPNTMSNPNSFETLVNMVKNFNLVIVQRCYLLPVIEKVVDACNLLGIPVVFETDDDYLSIIPSNPCYFALADQGLFFKYSDLISRQSRADQAESKDLINKINEMIPTLMESRAIGVENYKEILRRVDAVTTSTEELAATIYPYNRNVKVFENMVQFCYPWKLEAPESSFIEEDNNGNKKVKILHRLGMYTIPKFTVLDSKQIKKTPRVGYTCTASHWGEDWETIKTALDGVAEKIPNTAWYLFLGDNDRRFAESLTKAKGRAISLMGSEYEMYRTNTLNFDIGLAPVAPTVFNLCKSDIKAVEYGSCRIAPLLPYYKTYTRHFKDNESCLFYRNNVEFAENLSKLINNSRVCKEIADNAFEYVSKNRIAHLEENSRPRYDWYKEIINGTPRLEIYNENV